jgi:hypothetical protein
VEILPLAPKQSAGSCLVRLHAPSPRPRSSTALANSSLSVPFHPPAPVYISLEEQVKRIPNFGYMLYFSNPVAIKEIESNVCYSFPAFYEVVANLPSSFLLSLMVYTELPGIQSFIPKLEMSVRQWLEDKNRLQATYSAPRYACKYNTFEACSHFSQRRNSSIMWRILKTV